MWPFQRRKAAAWPSRCPPAKSGPCGAPGGETRLRKSPLASSWPPETPTSILVTHIQFTVYWSFVRFSCLVFLINSLTKSKFGSVIMSSAILCFYHWCSLGIEQCIPEQTRPGLRLHSFSLDWEHLNNPLIAFPSISVTWNRKVSDTMNVSLVKASTMSPVFTFVYLVWASHDVNLTTPVPKSSQTFQAVGPTLEDIRVSLPSRT